MNSSHLVETKGTYHSNLCDQFKDLNPKSAERNKENGMRETYAKISALAQHECQDHWYVKNKEKTSE